jgi:hypothetical protein
MNHKLYYKTTNKQVSAKQRTRAANPVYGLQLFIIVHNQI